MLRTYEGVLKGNRIDWRQDAPPSDRPLHVQVTVLEEECGDVCRGDRMAGALAAIADIGGMTRIDDAAEWQREIRADRPLPGRRPS